MAGTVFVVVSGPPASGKSTLAPILAVDKLAQLPGTIVEVFCRCDRGVARGRYTDRAGTRHAGHFDAVRTVDELWNDEVSEPVSGGWPMVEVDTNTPVDVGPVVAFIRRYMA